LENQPAKPKFWNSATLPIFLFRTNEFIKIDLNNILMSLLRMAHFIRNKSLQSKSKKVIFTITDFGQAAWDFILSIYKVE